MDDERLDGGAVVEIEGSEAIVVDGSKGLKTMVSPPSTSSASSSNDW